MVLSGLLTNLAAKNGRPQVAHSKKMKLKPIFGLCSLGKP